MQIVFFFYNGSIRVKLMDMHAHILFNNVSNRLKVLEELIDIRYIRGNTIKLKQIVLVNINYSRVIRPVTFNYRLVELLSD